MQPFNLVNLAIDLTSFFLGWFMGTAFGPLIDGVAQSGRPTSLRGSIVRAEAATDWRIGQRWRNTVGPRNTRSASSNDNLFLAGAVVLVVLYAYVKFSDVVALSLIFLSAGVVLAAAIALFTLWRRGVIDGRDSAIRILVGTLLGAIGITSAIFLVHPLSRHTPQRAYRAQAGTIRRRGSHDVGVHRLPAHRRCPHDRGLSRCDRVLHRRG